MDKVNTPEQRGEAFLKAIVKAAIIALFSIGVKSETVVNRFMIRFEEEVERRMKELGLMATAEPAQPESGATTVTKGDFSSTTEVIDESKVDIKEIKLHPFIIKALIASGINTLNDLRTAMQKDDLTKIKGIKEKSAEKIREAVKNYQA